MHNGNSKFPGNLKHHKNEVETTAPVLCPPFTECKSDWGELTYMLIDYDILLAPSG